MARERRPEIRAALARAAAAAQRPAIVSALEDPMLSPSIDHYPDRVMDEAEGGRRYDWSIAIEQRFPLSGLLRHRRRAAEAQADGAAAQVARTELDVELEAASAFFMLLEKRRMDAVLDEQLPLARQLVAAAAARYSSGLGGQADVLRAEVEVARLEATRRALAAEMRAAEAMLNAGIGQEPAAAVPPLAPPAQDRAPPSAEWLQRAALDRRPELRLGAAEVGRSAAELDAMRAMYWPMGMVRLGPSSTMAEGSGAMLMLGISIPVWRGKLRAGVDEARAMQEMAQADLDAMRRMAAAEAVAVGAEVAAARTRWLALRDDVVPRAQMAVAPALAAYSAGQGGLVAVIEAAQALWSVQAELVMAETALGLAWVRLERAVGGAADPSP